MDMNDTVQTEILTLEELQRQKAEALEELRAQKQVAVFDGAMLGIKLMKKVRKIFRR